MRSPLQEILNVPDPKERLKALLETARSLGIEPFLAQIERGRYNEEKLILLIFDALQVRESSRKRNLRAMSVFLSLGVMTICLIVLYAWRGQTAYRIETDESILSGNFLPLESAKSFPGAKPAKLVDGSYIQYDHQGRPQVEYFYRQGRLLWQKDIRGRSTNTIDKKSVP